MKANFQKAFIFPLDFNEFMKHWSRIGFTGGSLWGRFGVTLSILGGTLGSSWSPLGARGTSLGMFWGLKVLFGGLWRDLGRALGAYKQGTLIFARETKASATKKQTRRGCKEGAGRVQGGCKEGGSMGRKESGRRQVPLETLI